MKNRTSANRTIKTLEKSFIQAFRQLTGPVIGLLLSLSSNLVYAEGAAGAASGPDASSGMVTQLVMLGAFGFIFYFLIWRPQSKKAKQQRDLIETLQKGDEVITAGGILGKISRVKEGFLVLTIAEGTEIVIQKQAIAGTLPKGTMKDI